MSHFFTLISGGEDQNLTVFIPGEAEPITVHSSHPNFDQLVEGARGGWAADVLLELADVGTTVGKRFEYLTDRVAVLSGNLYFDGDIVDNSLATQVLRFLRAGVQDWVPLVNFFENVQQNPDAHSREQLYEWLSRHDFTIDRDGFLVGYKGVRRARDGRLVSIHSGPAIVDGESINGHVPNEVGSLIEIPRSYVHSDPAVGCSTGLHVGTWEYAKGFSGGAVLRVSVNPRDVVSVPTDCNAQKVRVCRYAVEEIIDAPLAQPLLDSDYEDEALNDYYGW